MKKYLFIASLLIIMLLTGCKYNEALTTPRGANVSIASEAVEKPKLTRETYPRVDGSTATIPLSEAIASSILGITKNEAKTFIKHNTTHVAYLNLINKTADMILVTEPSKEELKMAKDSKIELEVFPIVKEGFVFLVNTKNPIKSLTTKQLQNIYQGNIKNWRDVGGENGEILAYQRDANSGSQTLMEQTVMKGLPMAESPKTVVSGMEGLIERIAKYDNSERALGFSVFYYAKTMYNKDTIKFIAIDGIYPNDKTISSGEYPFSSSYYAIVRKSDPINANSRKLIKWLLGKDGQNLAKESGYIPLEVR